MSAGRCGRFPHCPEPKTVRERLRGGRHATDGFAAPVWQMLQRGFGFTAAGPQQGRHRIRKRSEGNIHDRIHRFHFSKQQHCKATRAFNQSSSAPRRLPLASSNPLRDSFHSNEDTTPSLNPISVGCNLLGDVPCLARIVHHRSGIGKCGFRVGKLHLAACVNWANARSSSIFFFSTA